MAHGSAFSSFGPINSTFGLLLWVDLSLGLIVGWPLSQLGFDFHDLASVITCASTMPSIFFVQMYHRNFMALDGEVPSGFSDLLKYPPVITFIIPHPVVITFIIHAVGFFGLEGSIFGQSASRSQPPYLPSFGFDYCMCN